MESNCCSSCHLVLKDPHIECNECEDKVIICVECFSKGREFGLHENSHQYKVIKKHITVLDKEWSAEEEMLFLNALVQRGHGNWEDISKVLINKSPLQCEEHFDKIYIQNEQNLFLDAWMKPKAKITRCDQPVDYALPLDVPLRPLQKMTAYKDLAGYHAARGDFEFELDNGFERELDAVHFANIRLAAEELETCANFDTVIPEDLESKASLDKLESHLQLAALDVYRNKISSRQSTKKVVRELGLLNKSKVISRNNMYSHLKDAGAGYSLIYKLGRLLCTYDHDYLLESLKHDLKLRNEILHLQEYRRNGLVKFVSTAFFSKLKMQRKNNLKQVSNETVSDWVHFAQEKSSPMQLVSDKSTGNLVPTIGNRKSVAPLDIIGTPGYEKLSTEERDLCSEVRVLPDQYLDIKEILISECTKHNGLRLADARPLAKIDVNKTKKIYNFLVSQAFVYKP